MNAKDLWEASRRTCDTIADLAVDKQTSAQLRRLQAILRGPAQKAQAKKLYDLTALTRDALTHGDKEDAQRLLGQALTLLSPETEAPKAALADAPSAPIQASPEKADVKAETPAASPAEVREEAPKPVKEQTPQAAPQKAKKPSALRSWALRTFGGEKGRIQAEIGQLEQRIATWEAQRAAMTRRRDELQAALRQKVELARTLDPRSSEYQELRHEAMMIKPEADVYSAQVAKLMANVEKYSGLIAAYHANLLNRETGLKADEISRVSVRLEDIESANEEAEALQRELDGITGQAQGILSAAAAKPAELDSFFDDLVAGHETPPAKAAPRKAEPVGSPARKDVPTEADTPRPVETAPAEGMDMNPIEADIPADTVSTDAPPTEAAPASEPAPPAEAG